MFQQSFAAFAITSVLTSGPAVAFEWNLQPGDQRVSGDYLQRTLTGHSLHYSDNSREIFHADGRYSYRSPEANADAPGVTFSADGVRCILYAEGQRCDLYVVNDGAIVLVNGVGQRYRGTLRSN